MRTVKFRAWCRNMQEMIEVTDLHISEKNPWVKDGFGGFTKNFELLQWTGLKDKNGIEIYEGDIVATPFGYNCEIRWNVNGHWGYWRTVDGATYKEDYWECEVIGNIYENPELLKGA